MNLKTKSVVELTILIFIFLIVVALFTSGINKTIKLWQEQPQISKPDYSKSPTLQVFEEHMKTCPECSKEVDNDNGPPPLCERGFELLQRVMKEGK